MFNKITDTLNVHQSRATKPIENEAELKVLYDQDVNTVKTRFNQHIDELSDTTASDNIGISASGVTSTTVSGAIAEVQANVAGATVGALPDNSITETKMVAAMKKQAGGVAAYDDLASTQATVTAQAAQVTANTTNIDNIRLAKGTTGSLNAYIMGGTFDYTKDGNMIPINPNFTNTGASTIELSGSTKNIRKYDTVTDAYVSLGAEDLKKNTPTFLRYDVAQGFFVLAPRGGAITTQNENNVSKSNTVTRTQTDGLGTSTVTAITLPNNCKSFSFTDSRLNGGNYASTPLSYLIAEKSASVGPGITSSVNLYNASGVLIGTLLSLSVAAGFTGQIYTYIQQIELIQVGSQIRLNANKIDSNISTIVTSLFSGNLSNATIKLEAYIYGTNTGTITSISTLNGVASTYSN